MPKLYSHHIKQFQHNIQNNNTNTQCNNKDNWNNPLQRWRWRQQHNSILHQGTNKQTKISNNVQKKQQQLQVVIINIYIRPRATSNHTTKLLDWIGTNIKNIEKATIIAGDLNATNAIWNNIEDILENKEESSLHYKQIKEARGRSIANFLDRHPDLTCLNSKKKQATYKN